MRPSRQVLFSLSRSATFRRRFVSIRVCVTIFASSSGSSLGPFIGSRKSRQIHQTGDCTISFSPASDMGSCAPAAPLANGMPSEIEASHRISGYKHLKDASLYITTRSSMFENSFTHYKDQGPSRCSRRCY